MKKDDLVVVSVEDMSSEGMGVGHVDGLALFVKDTVIGDVAEVKIMKMKKNYGYARLVRLLTPSRDRIEPPCPVARQCGGCQIQAMSYEAQLRFKEKKVRENLQRIGKFENLPMEPIIGMKEPYRYRNKAQFPVGKDKSGKLIAGFYAGRTHSIIGCRDCLLGHEINQVILDIVLQHMEKYRIPAYDETTGDGLVRHVMTRVGYRTGQIMVCLVINGRKLPGGEALAEELMQVPGMASITLSSNLEKTNVIMGKKLSLLAGKEYIHHLNSFLPHIV